MPSESLNQLAFRLGTTPLRLLELNPYLDPAELLEGLPVLAPLLHAHYGQNIPSLRAGSDLSDAEFRELNPHLSGGIPLPGQRFRRG